MRAQSRIETLRIDMIAAGGDGVGRVDGMAVFVPRSAPAEDVEVSLVSHGRFARGHITRVLTPSDTRVEPLCKHYVQDNCGGCQLQHMNADAQRAAKARIVCDSLSRIGKREVELPEVAPSPKQWDYRQKLTLSLVRNSSTREWVGGLHPLGQPDKVFPLDECRIADPALVAAWHRVRVAAQHLPDAHALRLTFRLVPDTDRVALTVAGGAHWKEWARFAASVPSLGGLWWISATNVRTELIAAESVHQQTAVNFVQVNAGMAQRMHTHVLETVKAYAPSHVVDAYAGVGELAIALTECGVSATAIEWDHAAVALMRDRMPAGSAALASPVEDVIERAMFHPSRPDVVVLNPPREGVDEFVATTLEQHATSGVRAVVYVSCDPATLARDLKRMPSWRIASVRCFDMFPQTAHVETVCVLIPEAA
ncbi:MAG: class I SAM-dependent RNA methyltransferase [Gemmatimonas sp.]